MTPATSTSSARICSWQVPCWGRWAAISACAVSFAFDAESPPPAVGDLGFGTDDCVRQRAGAGARLLALGLRLPAVGASAEQPGGGPTAAPADTKTDPGRPAAITFDRAADHAAGRP